MITQEQLAERKKGIGGSDWHHVMNEPPYGCARLLWYDKRSQEPDYPVAEEDVMARGKALEDVTAARYEHETGRDLRRRNHTLVHPDHPWWRVHIDRHIVAVDGKGPGVCELKNPGREMYYKMVREGLAIDYVLQLQAGMAATGWDWGSFGVLWADGWQFIHFDVEYDYSLVDTMIERGGRFWKMVENGPCPDRLDPKDKRCSGCMYRTTCQGALLLASVDTDEDGEIETDVSLDPLVAKLIAFEEVIKEAEEEKRFVKEQIKDRIGSRPIVNATGFRFYFRPHVSRRLKASAIKKELPEVYAKYSYEIVTRPLRKFSI